MSGLNAAHTGFRISPWAPLRHRAFAVLFAAQLGVNIGSFLQSVAAAWLMGDLSSSATMVALVQTSAFLPILVFGLVAGALADVFDRRALLIAVQLWMLSIGSLLTLLTALERITPVGLLLLTAGLGAGVAVTVPTWQSLQPDLVPPGEFTQAVALSSLTYNLGRAIGPAIGGVLVAAGGPFWAFAANTASFLVVMVALVWWRPPLRTEERVPQRLREAFVAGCRYARGSSQLHSVLIRTGAFMPGAAALHALLPSVVRERMGYGSTAYGLLLGCFGVGAVGAAVVRPRLEVKWSRDAILAGSSVVFAGTTVVVGFSTSAVVVGAALTVAGACWTSGIVTLSVSAQHALPDWVRARGLGFYMLVFGSGLALGSALWGVLAAVGLPFAHLAAATTLLVGSVATARWRLEVPATARR